MNNFHRACPSGNSLVDFFRPKAETCNRCGGEGLIPASFEELRDYIWNLSPGMKWQKMHTIYRDWKNDGKRLECPECEGRGKI